VIAIAAVPRATYRLQFGPQFTFRDATAIIPYLHELGISHVYASPFFKARPGSTHGYDITDHNDFNPEIGSPADFTAFSDALRSCGMGLIVDFVPNHMGIGQADNEWWLDVLEWGQSSVYADFFDIDWMPRQQHLQGKVLVPLLGDHYGAVLERGEIELRFDEATGTLSAWYHQHRFPIRPRHYAIVIRRQLARADVAPQLDDGARSLLEQLAADFDKLRRPGRRLREAARARSLSLKTALAEYCRRDSQIADFISAATAAFNGVPGDPRSFRPLHGLLEHQVYRLAFWRVAANEVNYRRFFNINELAGIRIENPALFELTHRLVGWLMREGRLQGLRIDHVDGLFDPEEYCQRLRRLSETCGLNNTANAVGPALYIVVEKILAHHEFLHESWQVDGTTGYEFVNLLNGLFLEPGARLGLDGVYRQQLDHASSFEETLVAAKSFVIDNLLASEISVLAAELNRISESNWRTRDYTYEHLRAALKDIVVYFPVYRTYVTGKRVSAADRRDIDWAVSQAKRRWSGPDPEIFDFVRAALTTDLARRGGPFRRGDVVRFAIIFSCRSMRWAAIGANSAFRRPHFTKPIRSARGNFHGRCLQRRPTIPSGARTRGCGSVRCPRCRRPGGSGSGAGHTSISPLSAIWMACDPRRLTTSMAFIKRLSACGRSHPPATLYCPPRKCDPSQSAWLSMSSRQSARPSSCRVGKIRISSMRRPARRSFSECSMYPGLIPSCGISRRSTRGWPMREC
jgi:(1->4)-alpha-D-glucan 1-alpha-D-glucosylmutase